jgi:hypothetical protein
MAAILDPGAAAGHRGSPRRDPVAARMLLIALLVVAALATAPAGAAADARGTTRARSAPR